MDKNEGEYASLDEMAGLVEPEDARSVTETIRAALLETTDLALAETYIVGTPVVLRPGQALGMSALDSQGNEFDVFVRPRS